MDSRKRSPATTLPVAADSTPFFIERFQGRKNAISHGPHRHRFFEVIVIEKGRGTQLLEGKQISVKRGDVFVISPGESHDPDGLDSTLHWIIAFDASFITRKSQSDAALYSGLPGEIVLLGFARTAESGPTKFKLSNQQLLDWVSTLERARNEFNKKRLGWIECTQALLSLILIDLARLTSPEMTYEPGESRATLASFFAELENQFRAATNLRMLSKSVGLSGSHLTQLLGKETGKTAMEWLRARRIAEAKLLLRESNRSIKEIAFEIGYADSNLMIRHFRQETGLSPKAWKNSLA